ncbi:TylF/MycF/NovP-related O-methyltransferase [Radicibacter daui]|uniref:TylF/MycF/NovP-related O-methyltransferase n=1 Tax=Radicibacter daui TaxID=3064829 RepID=UPI004046FE5E
MANYTPAETSAIYEAENTFYLRGAPSRLGKLLAHYELYRMIEGLPGAVVEMGVYKGASLVRFATFRHLLENNFSRPIYGFDAFGAFPRGEVAGCADRAFIERFEAAGGEGISRAGLATILAEKGFANISLVEGNIFESLPRFLVEHPAERIALLHLDLDVYEPTAFAIEQLLPRMAPGGLIAFDDYGLVEGATRAADELCARLSKGISKLPHYVVPTFLRV